MPSRQQIDLQHPPAPHKDDPPAPIDKEQSGHPSEKNPQTCRALGTGIPIMLPRWGTLQARSPTNDSRRAMSLARRLCC